MAAHDALKRPGTAIAVIMILGAAFGAVGIWSEMSGREQADDETMEQPGIVGQPRPDFILPHLDGAPRAAKEWDGKVLAVNFWATWCPPCKREIPSFNALQKELGAAGLQFVGIAIDEPKAVTDYTQEMVIDYPVLVSEDEGMRVAQQYGNAAGILPYTVIIDRQGRIAFARYGELSEKMAREVIKSLL